MDMNKKAQIASFMTWFVAFLIIFFIMFLYTAGILLIAANKRVRGEFAEIKMGVGKSDLDVSSFLMAFLETRVEYKGEVISLYDFIQKSDFNEEDKEIFENNIKDVFEKAYPYGSFTGYIVRIVESKNGGEKEVYPLNPWQDFQGIGSKFDFIVGNKKIEIYEESRVRSFGEGIH